MKVLTKLFEHISVIYWFLRGGFAVLVVKCNLAYCPLTLTPMSITNSAYHGFTDDDYSDLGDLDDLDGDSDSNIDDTLEAEIAAELGDG